MNTPKKAKAPTRWSKTRDLEGYNLQIWPLPDPYTIRLGRFLAAWVSAEQAAAELFGLISGGKRPSDEIVYHSLTSNNTRITLMRNILQFSVFHHDSPKDFDDLLARFESLCAQRNHIMHWQWGYDPIQKICFLRKDSGSGVGSKMEAWPLAKLDEMFLEMVTFGLDVRALKDKTRDKTAGPDEFDVEFRDQQLARAAREITSLPQL